MNTIRYFAMFLVVGVVATGCATTSSLIRLAPDYSAIPQQSLMEIALEVEQAVLAGEREPQIADRADVIINQPELIQAIRTRALRNELVRELRALGYVYENESGLIGINRGREYKRATTSRERDRHALLVMSENENRWQLYEGLLKANNWSPRSLSAVQETFASARRQVTGG